MKMHRCLNGASFTHLVINSLVLLIIAVISLSSTAILTGDGPHVRRYEAVLYNPTELRDQHSRHKRNVDGSESPVNINFHSHGRNFKLNLGVDDSVFHPQVIVENSEGVISHDIKTPLRGYVEDDPGSSAYGVLSSNGAFDGFIETSQGEGYYVEPSAKYWGEDPTKPIGIMYRAEDVEWPSPQGSSSCESHKLHLVRKENSTEAAESHQHNIKRSRNRRWIVDHKKKTCMLYLQADHLFFARFGSEEAAINVMTGHIQRVNEIYRNTDFNLDGEPDDVQFMIKRIKVHTKNRTIDATYPFDGHYEVIKFLELFSEGDYDSFCLAYMFTFRDFEGGTLGLAWTGDLKNAGGVCEKKGHFRGGVKSLNTGIITLLNYGKVVSPAVSHVTLAHEIGHNFGSPHDPESDRVCTPGGEGGNFIMFARATAGDKRNNNMFSPCSLRSINPVLSVKARDTYGCFTEPQKSICGNGVVEEDEECDCGWEEDCKESCCYPMRRYTRRGEQPCTLRRGSQCSPSKGPCCTGNCTHSFGNKCRDDNGCRNTAYCDGYRAECPPSILKPNKTICDKNSFVCFMGECTGSICLAYGLDSCQCGQQLWGDRSTKLCEVCCKMSGDNQPCRSSFDWNEPPYNMAGVLAKPGTPCRNYTGYCDSYNACREVDPSGPLATLRKLLSADEGLATIAEWIDNHWYAVVGAIALLIFLMILVAKFCGKRAKKRLRKLTVFHSNIEAIQVQRSYVEDGTGHTVHPTAVRKKIPFKKKVRERRTKYRSQKARERKAKADAGASTSGKTIWRRNKNDSKVQIQLPEITETTTATTLPQNSESQPTSSAAGSAAMSSRGPGPSLPSSSSTSSNMVNHNHEPKTAIVPHAKRKQVKHRERVPGKASERKQKASSATTYHHKTGKTESSANANAATKATPSTKKLPSSGSETKSTNKPKDKPKTSSSKHNIQVVYKPPFSVKVEMVPQTESSSSSKSPSTSKPSGETKSNASPSSGSSSGPRVKASTSTSLLKRGKSKTSSSSKYPKSLGKSELQILIPKTQEEDESGTPQPLTS